MMVRSKNGGGRCRRSSVAACAVVVLVLGTATAQADETTRVSVASDGSQSNGQSIAAAISGDGRFVAFSSGASNLVVGDTNGARDIFVYDRQAATTTRVSVASDGSEANGNSDAPVISADGRFVAFSSNASNLVAGDSNNAADVFVRDRQTGTTTRVSVASDGSQGNGQSFVHAISADGRFVVFESSAWNLTPGDSNGARDVFVHDRQTGTTTRVSVAAAGGPGNDSSYGGAISADGRFVAFSSDASNLVAGDSNHTTDVFVYDRQSGQTTRVSVASDGTEGNGSSSVGWVSADGRFVTFQSNASNLVLGDTNIVTDVFVHDRETGETTRVSVASDGSQGNGSSSGGGVSDDGRFVVFSSYATNLVIPDVNGGTDDFVYDRQTGETTRVSVASDGTQGNRSSNSPVISADGGTIAFLSDATNLVADDTNRVTDVFVRAEAVSPPPPPTCVASLPFVWPTGITPRPADDPLIGTDYAMFNSLASRPDHYHTGIDVTARRNGNRRVDEDVFAPAKGIVVAVCPAGAVGGCVFNGTSFSDTADNDGLQGVVILQHTFSDGSVVYSLFGHLRSVEPLQVGQCLVPRTKIGTTGAVLDKHLLVEIKTKPVFSNPVEQPGACVDPLSGKLSSRCWEYVLVHPSDLGYLDPIDFFHQTSHDGTPTDVAVTALTAPSGTTFPPNIRKGPGGLEGAQYKWPVAIAAGMYTLVGKAPGTDVPYCPDGWYQIQRGGNDCTNPGDCFVAGVNSGGDNILSPDGWVCGAFVPQLTGAN